MHYCPDISEKSRMLYLTPERLERRAVVLDLALRRECFTSRNETDLRFAVSGVIEGLKRIYEEEAVTVLSPDWDYAISVFGRSGEPTQRSAAVRDGRLYGLQALSLPDTVRQACGAFGRTRWDAAKTLDDCTRLTAMIESEAYSDAVRATLLRAFDDASARLLLALKHLLLRLDDLTDEIMQAENLLNSVVKKDNRRSSQTGTNDVPGTAHRVRRILVGHETLLLKYSSQERTSFIDAACLLVGIANRTAIVRDEDDRPTPIGTEEEVRRAAALAFDAELQAEEAGRLKSYADLRHECAAQGAVEMLNQAVGTARAVLQSDPDQFRTADLAAEFLT